MGSNWLALNKDSERTSTDDSNKGRNEDRSFFMAVALVLVQNKGWSAFVRRFVSNSLIFGIMTCLKLSLPIIE
jgi:hypothetical protein